MRNYDYIFAGAGMSGLMTAYRMAISGLSDDKSILMIDPNGKSEDKTWCYWETGIGIFDEILFRKWDQSLFRDSDGSKLMHLFPYQYKMIRSADFYAFCKKKLSAAKNIDFINSAVDGFSDDGNMVTVRTGSGNFTCRKLINSTPPKHTPTDKYPLLQQHFRGWFIKTSKSAFDPAVPTLMDFSVSQKGNTRFMYVLPFSETEALIEYTLFSAQLLDDDEYEAEIARYLHDQRIDSYEIVSKERGSIPMTVFPFWENNSANVINIGSAGGWTKPSTGYTFRNSMKQSERLVSFLHGGTDFRTFHKTSRFWFYDLLLLDILHKKNETGSAIFSSMFMKRKVQLIFKFLDEETSLIEDIKVISACPKRLFIKALVARLFRFRG